MVELDKYANTVLWSYALSILALALLILVTWRSSRLAKRDMDAAEARRSARKAAQNGA